MDDQPDRPDPDAPTDEEHGPGSDASTDGETDPTPDPDEFTVTPDRADGSDEEAPDGDSDGANDTDDGQSADGTGDGQTGGEADGEAASEGRDIRERIEAAITEVRREALKAAGVSALVDGVAVFLLVNLLVVALEPGWLPTRIALPGPLSGALEPLVGAGAALPGSALLAGVGGVLTFGGELYYRTRTPLVEQFEAVNPGVAESLRTARDAVAADANSRMALRLYEDVLDGLAESSSHELVDWRRVGGVAAVVVVVSLVTLQLVVVDVALVGPPAVETNDTSDEDRRNYTGLRDGDEVLGAAEQVDAGQETLTARVESSGGGREVENEQQFPQNPGGGGGGDGGGVEGQQAGFASPEDVEDADLVREYNRRIRESDAGDDETSGNTNRD